MLKHTHIISFFFFFVCNRYYMLRVCLPYQQESSFCHTNTMTDTPCIFSLTEPPWLVDAWPCCGSVCAICLFLAHNNASHSSGTAARFGILAVANLRSYPRGCTDAIIGILALSIFSTTQYAQWGASNEQPYDCYIL